MRGNASQPRDGFNELSLYTLITLPRLWLSVESHARPHQKLASLLSTIFDADRALHAI